MHLLLKAFLAFITVAALFKIDHLIRVRRHTKDGKLHLAFLRQPQLWTQEYETNPYRKHWDMMVCDLNLGGNLRTFDVTYADAKLIGSTPEELWQIHHDIHRWYVEQAIDNMRNGQYVVKLWFLVPFLEHAECTLESLGLSKEAYGEIQRHALISCIKRRIEEYKESSDSRHLMALRMDFDNADACQLDQAEIDAIAEEAGLDEEAGSMLSFAADVHRDRRSSDQSNDHLH